MTITTTAKSAPSPIVTLPGPGKKWGAPVKVTPENGYGYEPSFIVDKYGNAFATAHKENLQIPLAPDPNSPQRSRSMSWLWLSVDKGQTWVDPPGLTLLSLEQREVGDEGDLGYDDAGHIYFVDTYAADITLTRWTTNGLGQVLFDFTRPLVPTPEVDDRPWVVAHGNGHVFYFSNTGNKVLNGGRYTVHASYDGGLDVRLGRRPAARLRLVPAGGRPQDRLSVRVRSMHQRQRHPLLVRELGRRPQLPASRHRRVQRQRGSP